LKEITMHRLLRWSGMAALCLTASACKEPAPPQSEVRPVVTMAASSVALEETHVQSGEVRARYETDLGFRMSGRLVARHVDVGSFVRKGDVLALLDDEEAANAVRAAEAGLVAAEAARSVAEGDEARQSSLLEKGIVAKARYDQASRDLAIAVASLDQANVQLKDAKERHGYTKLVAERDGVVTAVGGDAGQVVGSGMMVVRLASLDEREAVFNLAERLLRDVAVGTAVEVGLADEPSIRAAGTIREITPSADRVTRTFTVRVALAAAPEEMRLGSTVTGKVLVAPTRVFALPAAALSAKGSAPAVFVFEPETSTLELRPVEVARYEETRVAIASGLAEGEEVVVAGVNRLRPGQAVRMEKEELP
jgi:RND family efflux transporter MFP subunit